MKTAKQCTKCKTIKKLSAFNKGNQYIDGLRYYCRLCEKIKSQHYRHSKEGIITSIYGNQRESSRRRGHDMPTYTKKELREWLYSQKKFHILYDNWKRLDYQKMYIPSVDRKEDAIGYTMSNIQLMTWGENNIKGNIDMRSGKLINGSKPQKPVIQLTKYGEFIEEYISIIEADRQTGVNFANISKCCMGKRKSAGGFIWRTA